MDRQDIPDVDRQPDSVPSPHPTPSQQIGAPPPTPNADKKLDNEEALEERMSAFERSTVRLTTISIGVAIIVGLAVFAQWWEMHTSGLDTHALAEAAKQQVFAAGKSAQAAQNFASSAALINGNINDAVGKLDAQAKATQRSANAAKSAADTAIAGLRPWIKISDVQTRGEGPIIPALSFQTVPLLARRNIASHASTSNIPQEYRAFPGKTDGGFRTLSSALEKWLLQRHLSRKEALLQGRRQEGTEG
jgi:hypothetical protein